MFGAVCGLRHGGGTSGQFRAGGCVRIDGVCLTALAPGGAAEPVDFDDVDAFPSRVSAVP
jgi:hypothetical protein